MTQALLPLSFSDQTFQLEYFFPTEPGCYEILKNIKEQTLTQTVYISGPSGSGKTHLLQATALNYQSIGLKACYLPCREHHELHASHLRELGDYDLVLIDDLSHLLHHAHWQQALFDLFNTLINHPHRRLVFADQLKPQSLHCERNDLITRLCSGATFHLPLLNEIQLKQVAQHRIHAMGMHMPEKILDFLLHHTSRNPKIFFELLHALDQASLEQQQPLTIPFVKAHLRKNNIQPLTGNAR